MRASRENAPTRSRASSRHPSSRLAEPSRAEPSQAKPSESSSNDFRASSPPSRLPTVVSARHSAAPTPNAIFSNPSSSSSTSSPLARVAVVAEPRSAAFVASSVIATPRAPTTDRPTRRPTRASAVDPLFDDDGLRETPPSPVSRRARETRETRETNEWMSGAYTRKSPRPSICTRAYGISFQTSSEGFAWN